MEKYEKARLNAGLEEIVSLLREYELTEEDKNQIISLLQDFLINKSK